MNENHRPSLVPGLLLVAVGIAFLLANLGTFRIQGELIWTYLLIIMGAVFWLGFIFDRSRVGSLMPGSILLTIGILFHYTSTHGWETLSYLWPFFILAPAFGFYAMFIFGAREKGLLVPAGILTVIALFFFLQGTSRDLRLVWPAVLIALGVLLIYRGRRAHKDWENEETGGES
jgi:drug/metabolite transporter (DMT)-like permease